MWIMAENVLETDLGDELVLMHAGLGEMFSLNDSGRVIWQALPAPQDTLAELLASTYGLTTAQARADVQALLLELARRTLVRQVDVRP
ncbi:PqqD family protein [Deinococcus oregonensis]|uniref:PqqD family protein n=1 Tax=Deinococcus oregonensis TaxID=1805970 RepID=A0ABV6B3E0_9DEIO